MKHKHNWLNSTSRKLMLILLLFTVITSCQKDISIENNKKEDNEVVKKLKQLGYNTDIVEISTYKNYYVLEGDILVKKEEIENSSSFQNQLSKIKKLAQTRTNNTVSSINSHNINIVMNQSIWSNPYWYYGLRKAVKVWNSVQNSNIKLNLLDISDANYYSIPIDIMIKGDNNTLNPFTAAMAEFPTSNGKPGGLIIVNSDFSILNNENATWNIIHEIGHCLGLRHTNWLLRGETAFPYGAIDIPNTPNSNVGDVNSIMNGGTANYEFGSNQINLPSQFDITATTYLFPLNLSSNVTAYITGPTTIQKYSQDTFHASYASDETGIYYKWEARGMNNLNFYQEYTANTNSILDEITFDYPGQYELKCTITGGKYNTPIIFSKIITVI